MLLSGSIAGQKNSKHGRNCLTAVIDTRYLSKFNSTGNTFVRKIIKYDNNLKDHGNPISNKETEILRREFWISLMDKILDISRKLTMLRNQGITEKRNKEKLYHHSVDSDHDISEESDHDNDNDDDDNETYSDNSQDNEDNEN